MIKGVIFDLDGVITDTAKLHYIAWKNLAKSIGIDIDEEFNESLKGISRVDSLIRILEYGGVRDKYTDSDIKTLTDKKNDEYVKLLGNLTKDDILPGIEAFIKELKDKNIKIGLASVSKNAGRILDILGILDQVDFIADPTKVEKSKPAPDIFIESARGIGLDISQVFGIEDSQAGVEAMKACDMRSVGIGVDADLRLETTQDLSLEKIALYFE
nr:beta-phosphoglucomutase [uncultured Peptostreptococcus sp.]